MTPTLFPPPRARRTDPAESREAAKAATPTSKCAELMLALFMGPEPFTDEELCDYMKLANFTGPTVRRTRKALADSGLIVECGQGVTAAGRACRTWRKA